MGFIDPIEHHHNNERGKDIVCKEFDEKFNKYNYISLIVKTGDITGSSSSNGSMFNIINQLKQSINDPYKHIYDVKEVYIDSCMIVTNGTIKPTALESIYSTLRSEHIDKAIREIIDISNLVSLIDKYLPEYWHEEENKYDRLINERNHLLNNAIKLLDAFIYNKDELKKIKRHIAEKEFEVDIDSFHKTNMYVANINYKKVEIDKIDSYYVDEVYNQYGNIPEGIYSIRKTAERILFEIDEVVCVLKDILIEENPLKVLENCESLRVFVGGYSNNFSFNTRDIHCIDDLYSGIQDYTSRKEELTRKQLLGISRNIYLDMERKLLPQFFNIFSRDSCEKDYWLGYKIKIIRDADEIRLKSEVYDYKEEIQLKQERFAEREEIEKVYINNENYICIEYAIHNYGFWEEKTIEEKSNARLQQYYSKVTQVISNYDSDTIIYEVSNTSKTER